MESDITSAHQISTCTQDKSDRTTRGSATRSNQPPAQLTPPASVQNNPSRKVEQTDLGELNKNHKRFRNKPREYNGKGDTGFIEDPKHLDEEIIAIMQFVDPDT
jgi:hypothetical protein